MTKIISQKPNTIILWAYLFIVLSICSFINLPTLESFWLFLPVCAIMSFFISKGLMLLADRLPACAENAELTPYKAQRTYRIFFLISFEVFCLYFIAYYPGWLVYDTIVQCNQAAMGRYNDWHPAWHTILSCSVPLALTGGRTASIVLFHITYFSLVLGYMAQSMYRFAGRKAAIISVACILLLPIPGYNIAICPMKDSTMAITILWAMVCVANICYTGGQWAEKRGRTLLVAVVLANATLFRHNAVLFTLPLVFALFFWLRRKKWLELAILFFLIVFTIKVPVYSFLHVSKPGSRHLETMGLPLTVIANVTKEHPERLDEKTSAFVYKMASQETWEKYFSVNRGLNSIKYEDRLKTSIVEETSRLDILGMMLRCFKVAPVSSCKALFSLTSMVYTVGGNLQKQYILHPDIGKVPNINNDELGIVYSGNETLRDCLRWLYKIPEFNIYYIGLSILLMLTVILNRSNLKKWSDWKRILLCLPIFIYDFGTMLLLMGTNDTRFFYVSFLICPVVILIMLKNKKENNI